MDRAQVLVVDDVDINRMILEEILSADYDVFQADGGIAAIDYLFNCKRMPSMVLLDIMMPEMDGYEVLEVIRANEQTSRIPVMFITAAEAKENETRGINAGAVDYISKPFNVEVVRARVKNHIALKVYQDSLESLVQEQVQELTRTKENMLETMANIIEYRNLESGQHVKRTRHLAEIMVNRLVMDPRFEDELRDLDVDIMVKAVPLHDVGKIGIADDILLKPGKLTPEEFEVIKTHTTIGSDIIDSMLVQDNSAYLRHCRDICRYHHERWDGKGYPDGLSGREIPLSARIMAVVDVYDALTSERVYKPPFSHEKAVGIILEGAGTQFDANLVDVMLKMQEYFRQAV